MIFRSREGKKKNKGKQRKGNDFAQLEKRIPLQDPQPPWCKQAIAKIRQHEITMKTVRTTITAPGENAPNRGDPEKFASLLFEG